jgi:hypothetical protein
VSFTFSIEVETGDLPEPDDVLTGSIADGDLEFFFLTIDDDDVDEMTFVMSWTRDWSQYPTNDLDLILLHLDEEGDVDFFDIQAATLNSPEKSVIVEPMEGTWVLVVVAFSVPLPGEEESFTIEIFFDE